METIKLERDFEGRYPRAIVPTFGSNVRRLMTLRGLDQAALKDALGVKQGTLSDWMRDRRGLPETPTLIKFAKALKVSIEDLIEGVDADYEAVKLDRLREAKTVVSELRHLTDLIERGTADGSLKNAGLTNQILESIRRTVATASGLMLAAANVPIQPPPTAAPDVDERLRDPETLSEVRAFLQLSDDTRKWLLDAPGIRRRAGGSGRGSTHDPLPATAASRHKRRRR